MLPLFDGAATINRVNCDKPSDGRPWIDATMTMVQAFITSSRLDWCNSLYHRRVDATSAVGAECCGQVDHWHTTM